MFVHGRLPRPVRRRIVRLDRKTRNSDLWIRCRLVQKMDDGLSARAAALAVCCAPSTAWRVRRGFRQEGESGLLDRRAENGTLKANEDVPRTVLGSTPSTSAKASMLSPSL